MQTKTMMPLFLSERVRMLCSVILVIVTMMGSFFLSPLTILSVFFTVQVFVKIFTQDDNTNMPFSEVLIVGPLKLAVAVLMIGLGLPVLDSGAGLAWIGVALLFLYSGMQNMYWVVRSGWFSVSSGTAAQTTSKQQMKAVKAEDALLADLFSSIDGTDFMDKEK